MESLNQRPFKKLPGCRHSAFLQMDSPVLKPLPQLRYEYAEWKTARVGIDYHIEVAGHYYSVPYRTARQQVDVRTTVSTVEAFHRGQRIAAHVRSQLQGRHSTLDAHMPPAHQVIAGWNDQRLLDWARGVGSATESAVRVMLGARRHPQQSYRACLGVLRLAKSFGNERLDAACARALQLNAAGYRSIHSILKSGLDRPRPAATTQALLPLEHANVRGPEYYH